MVLSSYIIDFSNAKASTYSASGGKNPYFLYCLHPYSASGGKYPYFLVFSGCKTQNPFFFKVVATALKPSSKDASRKSLQIPLKIVEKGALSAELRPFYWSIRISVPMLYITFLILDLFRKENAKTDFAKMDKLESELNK